MYEYHGNNLPRFAPEEKAFMKNSIDFIGINHYSAIYAKDCTNASCSESANRAIKGFVEITGERDGVLIGDPVRYTIFVSRFSCQACVFFNINWYLKLMILFFNRRQW